MPFAVDDWLIHARLFQKVSDQRNKTVHLTSARDSRSRTRIANSRLSSLFLRLGLPARPELGDGTSELQVEFGVHKLTLAP